jgi:hypothetical protein
MKTYRKIVMFEWSEGLGEDWLADDNLKALLFTPKFTRPSVMEITDVTQDIKQVIQQFSEFVDETIFTSKEIEENLMTYLKRMNTDAE